MTTKTNSYFEGMKQIGTEFRQARAARELEKDILCENGDQDALNAWYEREKDIKFPFSDGQNKAYHAWVSTTRNESSTFEVQDLPWDRDIHDFVETLRAAGVEEFAVTDQSTALMGCLHRLSEAGCIMQGLCKISRSEGRWGGEDTTEYEGILFHT